MLPDNVMWQAQIHFVKGLADNHVKQSYKQILKNVYLLNVICFIDFIWLWKSKIHTSALL